MNFSNDFTNNFTNKIHNKNIALRERNIINNYLKLKNYYEKIKYLRSQTTEDKKVIIEEQNSDNIEGTNKEQQNEINTNEINTNEINTNEINTNEINTNEINTDEINTDDIYTNEINTNADNIFSGQESLNKLINLINTIMTSYKIDSLLLTNLISDNQLENNLSLLNNQSSSLIFNNNDSIYSQINENTTMEIIDLDDNNNNNNISLSIQEKQSMNKKEIDISLDKKEFKSRIDFNKIKKINQSINCNEDIHQNTKTDMKTSIIDDNTSYSLINKMQKIVKKISNKVESIMMKEYVYYSDVVNNKELKQNITGAVSYILLDKIDKLI
jgi:hypothetical protein